MPQKNFSLLLALRYLNPIRTNVSVITIISLLGVAAGVMVLVVSLSVMNGFERLLKDIVLTSRPHIYLEHRSTHFPENEFIEEADWRSTKKDLEALEYITSVSPSISDFVGLQLGKNLSPRQMIGVDIGNPDELQKLKNNIREGDVEKLLLGGKALISSKLQDSTGLQLGDQILLHSSSNIKKIVPVYERLNEPAFNEKESETIILAAQHIEKPEAWKIDEQSETTSLEAMRNILNDFLLPSLESGNLRTEERETIESICQEFQSPKEKSDTNNSVSFSPGTRARLIDGFQRLKSLDKEKMDAADLRALKEIVLPKEVEIVGILQTNNFASISDIFVSFDVAQDLVDLTSGIQGLSISLKDHTQATIDKQKLVANPQFSIGGNFMEFESKQVEWVAVTWMENSAQLFKIMEMQKFMMVFVLSFIVLVAVFSIAAVMFTVAIQKKREIGVMKALGATPAQIVNVFAFQGIFVGFIGSMLGLGSGLLIVINIKPIQTFIRESLNYNPFPQSIYGTETMPTHIIPMEFVVIGCGALILCTVASLIPAWTASRSDAAKSLRNL